MYLFRTVSLQRAGECRARPQQIRPTVPARRRDDRGRGTADRDIRSGVRDGAGGGFGAGRAWRVFAR
jgi:hypothetical protein